MFWGPYDLRKLRSIKTCIKVHIKATSRTNMRSQLF